MKKIVCLLLLALMLPTVEADAMRVRTKVERSEKEPPAWLDGVEHGYIITSASAEDMEEAKAIALEHIRKQIVEAVAVNVSSETSLNESETMEGEKSEYSSNYLSQVRTKSAKLGFLNRITLARATDSYWEKHLDKNREITKCYFAVKYPFSTFDLEDLVQQYQAAEAAIDSRIEKQKRGVNDPVVRVEEIAEHIAALQTIRGELDEEDSRCAQISAITNLYYAKYQAISLREEGSEEGILRFVLDLDGNIISSSTPPVVRSACADRIQSRKVGNGWEVRYDSYPCNPSDDNYIDVRFRVGSRFISQRIPIVVR